MAESDFSAAVRAFAAERGYGVASVERWLRLPAADATALLALARELRLGENQLRDLWHWAEDVAAREHTSLAAVLDTNAIVDARRAPLGRNDKLKRVKAELRRLRFPELTAAEERLQELVRRFDLPTNVVCRLPEFLEGDEVRVEIVARDAVALRTAAERLRAAADTTACAELFALLGEAP